MSMRPLLSALIAVAACAVVTPASALDPSTADAQAKQALAEGPYTFCKNPPKPLPAHAEALCDLA